MYSGYKSIILEKEPNEVLYWVNSLGKSATDYVHFRDVYDTDGKFYNNDFDLQNMLVMLKKTGSLQWHTVAFALSKAVADEPGCHKECLKTYWLLFNLILRFSLLDVRFNYLEKRLPKIARSIWGRKKYSLDENETEASGQFETYSEAIKYGQDCIRQLIDQHVPDSKITDDIFSSDIRDNNLFNCILRLCYLGKVPHGHSLDGDLTLEHVLPIDHSKWSAAISSADAEAIKFKLGNGILIRKDFNSSLQNNRLEEKHTEYVAKNIIDSLDNGSQLNVLRFTESSSWTSSVVTARTLEITQIIRPLILNRDLSCFR